ncbi:RDD family protein [Streptomyces sp. NPDC060035]|uniref:RDD family protein n=1 Tax=Streptomyces sp. NPDC060035 TaxID=3347044 RepID=UPI0036A1CED0
MRRYLAIALDGYLCLLAAGLLARPYVQAADTGRAVVLTALPALALSFVNQVLLTAAVRASAGKLIMGVRVIGLSDARRPGLGRLIRRWLYGLVRLPLQPWYWLRPLPGRAGAGQAAGSRTAGGRTGIPGPGSGQPGSGQPGGSRPGSEADDDVAGLRQVRRRDLRSYRSSVAAHDAA